MVKTKLHEVRVKKEILQEEMANLVGIKQSTYSRKERGVTDVTMEEWILMARVLDVNIEDIYRPNLRTSITTGKTTNKLANVSHYVVNEIEQLKKENAELKKENANLKEELRLQKENSCNQRKAV